VISSVQGLSNWLAATDASAVIQRVSWIIPTVQTVHILSIGMVLSSVLLLDLRILGWSSRGFTLSSVARRYLPWIWCTLIVLLVSGSTLIVGEPARSLQNPAFAAKMVMLAFVLLLTLSLQVGLKRDGRFWEASAGRRRSAKMIAILSLALWVGIVFAGRWIAYVDVDV
jgi:uncharacterized membrane protein